MVISYTRSLLIFFRLSTIPAYEKSRSTGAEDSMPVMHFTNSFFTGGYLCKLHRDVDLSSMYCRISVSHTLQ